MRDSTWQLLREVAAARSVAERRYISISAIVEECVDRCSARLQKELGK